MKESAITGSFFVCSPFRDKVMRMYDVANAGRSGMAYDVSYDTSMSSRKRRLAPKIFHLSVSHRKFLANSSEDEF